MNHSDFVDTLDRALARQQAGDARFVVLADFSADAPELEPLLQAVAALQALPPVDMPAPAALQADRAAFIGSVNILQQQAVSPGLAIRLKEQVVHAFPWLLFNLNHGKERRRMSALLLKTVIIFGLVFGSLGGTAVMAAQSLPNSPLYPVKMAMEQAQLAVTTDPAQLANRHLTMAQVRTAEMAQLAFNGDAPDAGVLNRLEWHLQQALHLAADMPAAEMPGLLAQVQQMTQTQAGQLTQTQAQAGPELQESLRQANRLLSQAGTAAQTGLDDPLAFRFRFGRNRPDDAPLQPPVESTVEPAPTGEMPVVTDPVPTEEPVVCPNGNCDPQGEQYQYRHGQAGDTLPPYQHGDCTTPGECIPVGDQHQYGQDETLEPGHHGQPAEAPAGPGDCTDCAQNQNQNQHQNGQPVNQLQGQNGQNGQNGENGEGGQNSGGGSGESGGSNSGSDSNGNGGKKH